MAKKKSKKTTTKKTTAKKQVLQRKKQFKKESRAKFWSQLSDEVLSFIGGILMLVVSVFFFSAAFGYGGPVGDTLFSGIGSLLGVGYFLLPLLFLFIAISFFKNTEWKFTKIKMFGSFLFVISGLAIIDLLSAAGGSLGSLISSVKGYFGFWMTLLFMLAIFVISLVLVLGSVGFLSFRKVFSLLRRNSNQSQEYTDNEELDHKESAKIDKEIKNQLEGSSKKEEEKSKEQKQLANFTRPLTISGIGSKKSKEQKDAERLEQGLDKKAKENYGDKNLLPPTSLLSKDKGKPEVGDIKANAQTIKRTFANFGINIEMDEVSIGPTVTRYSFKPAEGVKLSRIDALKDDLALALAAKTLRMEAPIPGKALVGVEIPNKTKTMVGLGSLLESPEFRSSGFELPMALGKDISGNASLMNLAKAPHMLIAGQTGAGKSVTVHALINSLLFRHGPDALKFIMIDPKHVELSFYDGIPHLLTPVITNAKQTILALKWAVKEMERRYELLKEHGVQNIDSYHKRVYETYKGPEDDRPERMPYTVFIIDELADIMLAYPKELEAGIVALAQKSRAVGIHLILSTQRPSVNVITGLIKANIPTRVALRVSSSVDSRTILDMGGAEKLLGQGDMLFMTGSMSKPVRAQSAFISEDEVKNVVTWLKKAYKNELPDEIDLSPEAMRDNNVIFSGAVGAGDEDQDDLYEDARHAVIEAGKASTSYIQRKLRVGYARAARLIDLLEENGVVGPADGSRPREIILQSEDAAHEADEQE